MGIAGMGGRCGARRHLRVAVDGGLGDVAQQPARPVARAGEGEQRRIVVDEAGRHLPAPEGIVVDEAFEKGDVGRDAADAELPQRTPHAVDRGFARRRPGGDLLQQRIVVAGDDRTGVGGAAVEADAEPGRGPVGGDPPVVGDEAVERVLGRDPALHGMAAQGDLFLRRTGVVGAVADGASFRNAYLGAHEVDAGHLLGDGVLDLDARIDLDEAEAPAVEVVQELHRADVEVVRRPCQCQRVSGESRALVGAQAGGGGALHDLLVAPLHRAVALEQVDDVAVAVRRHLHLDVAGAADEALEVDVVLAEGGVGLAPCREQGRLELVRAVHDPHPAPAAAPARLEDAGEAHFLHESEGSYRIGRQGPGRGHRGHPGGGGDGTGGDLVSEPAQRFRARPDEGHARRLAGLGELRRFGEEAVARMDGVASRFDRNADDVVHRQVGADGALSLADRVGLVGLEAMQGKAVLVREDRDGGLAHLVGGAHDADRDLAAIGHEDALEFAHRFARPACRPPGGGRVSGLRGAGLRGRPSR